MIFFFCRRFGYSRLSFFLLVCLRTLYTFVLRYTTRKVFIFFFYLILRRLGGLEAQGLRGCRCSVMRSVMRSVMCSAMRSVLRSVSRNTIILGNLLISINFFVISLLQNDASVGDLVQLLVVGGEDNGFASCF